MTCGQRAGGYGPVHWGGVLQGVAVTPGNAHSEDVLGEGEEAQLSVTRAISSSARGVLAQLYSIRIWYLAEA